MPDCPICRSPADIAEAIAIQKTRITPAEAHGWTVMESLPADVKAQLDAWIDAAEVPRN